MRAWTTGLRVPLAPGAVKTLRPTRSLALMRVDQADFSSGAAVKAVRAWRTIFSMGAGWGV